MRRSGPTMVVGVLLVSLLGLTACGGHKGEPSVKTLTYRSGPPQHVTVADGGSEGSVRLEQIRYDSVDGQSVPALFTIPTDRAPLGCLVYQGGFGLTKEQAPGLRTGAAALRLATFTIDPRNVGARGSLGQAIAAIQKPETLHEMVVNTVVDLRVGLDYLDSRPECHHNVALMGTSFGAIVAAITAGQDSRIKATVLTSIGPSFKRGVLMTNLEAQKDSSFPLVMVPGAATNPKILAHAVSVLGPIDPDQWVGKIAPRPVMLINGQGDPLVSHADAQAIAAAAREPKTVLDVDAGHDPFGPGPEQQTVTLQVAKFLASNLGLIKSS
jgi:pimeloyl-ACP methyl ester carboxylesterase